MERFEAVVFDLDGTLLNTLEDLTDSVNVALRAYHCQEKSIEQVRTYVGNGIRKLIERCLEGGENHPDFEAIFTAFKEHYKDNCQNKTRPYDGVIELLRTLKAQGKKLAIVSNKADFAVKELNNYYFGEFNMVAIGESENVARKPAPDTVYQALKELNVTKDKAVYIGDSDVDVQTAKNAGLTCISVLWGFRDRALLEQNGAKYFANNCAEVLDLIDKL